jgi:hypothetical protein
VNQLTYPQLHSTGQKQTTLSPSQESYELSTYRLPTPEEQLQEKHANCSTQWVAFRWHHSETRTHGYLITQNHCKDRACPNVSCVQFRIGLTKERLRPYFDCIKKPKHIILTVPNRPLNEETKRWLTMKLNTFYKVLSRSKYQFFGVAVREYKPSSGGLYHPHVHIVANQSPHHAEVTKIWSRIVGTHCSTTVKYHASKRSLLNYFARRCAMAGVGLPPSDYINFVKSSRLFNSFGKFPSYLEVLQISQTEKRKGFVFYMLGSWQKGQNEDKPPDWLNEQYLNSLWEGRT